MTPDSMKELGVVRLAGHCPAKWSQMTGDARVRFCGECKLNVYNLSQMSADDARALLCANEGGRLCVRFYARADGTVITRDCPFGVRVGRTWSRAEATAGWLAALVAVFIVVTTLFGDNIRRLFGMASQSMAGWDPPPAQKFDLKHPPPSDAPDWLKDRARRVL
jgi:hypothetical protein